ncbi:hypothetical protein [Orrella sp. 11846]|uniref:hypothetical protein n=1 Tax=Orrella sp. 11846 TaxID=3409913 RepID=UPI003B5BD41F
MLSEFNRTHLEHAACAVLMQLAVWALTGSIWAGAAAGTFFFIGREHAQAEMRVPPSQSLREFRAFSKWRYWGWDSVLDFAAPLVATVVVAALWRWPNTWLTI